MAFNQQYFGNIHLLNRICVVPITFYSNKMLKKRILIIILYTVNINKSKRWQKCNIIIPVSDYVANLIITIFMCVLSTYKTNNISFSKSI